MKLITWNCNMAFRKKAEHILVEKPDILIVPECEHPDKLIFGDGIKEPYDLCWFGQNSNKGLGVFSYSNFKIELLKIHNPDFKFVLPLSIFNDDIKLEVLAVWTQKPKHHDCYTEQIWNAIHYYTHLLKKENVIIAGDFNSNSNWDKPNRVYNHSNLVDLLSAKGISSVYHSFNREAQGKESTPTLYLHRRREKPYHIDYCFVSKNLFDKIRAVEVGSFNNWISYSDHTPLIVTFDF